MCPTASVRAPPFVPESPAASLAQETAHTASAQRAHASRAAREGAHIPVLYSVYFSPDTRLKTSEAAAAVCRPCITTGQRLFANGQHRSATSSADRPAFPDSPAWYACIACPSPPVPTIRGIPPLTCVCASHTQACGVCKHTWYCQGRRADSTIGLVSVGRERAGK